ncbi:glycoside hydrolase family 31 protein [Lentisphaera marina]|uniref:TIM-barrel domain-containing protein n=1 Tax=Lentisphaera marina TaxID=1111041 RepID=UPI0023670953|nr:TIM-barrel domain-containing protein [Lentisphaera marina]MDD7984886.1 glycoside hydrolase family 31 protein [Lentisphaera marina]
MISFLYKKDIAVFGPHKNCMLGSSLAIEKDIQQSSKLPKNYQLIPTFSDSHEAYVSMPKVNEHGSFPVRQRTSFPRLIDYDFYGTGEQLGKLRKNDSVIPVYNRDNFMYEQGDNLYQSHPWVLAVGPCGKSYGFLADTSYRGEIDLRNQQICFEFEGEGHRVLVLEGESPQKVLRLLSELIGTISLPPKWALGYQQCRYSYMNEQEAKSIIDNFRSRQLPCDVIWFDIDYMDQFKIFTFDKKAFPQPKRMNDYAHQNNFKTVWMVDPGVKLEEGYHIYDELRKNSYYLKQESNDSASHDIKVSLKVSSNKEQMANLIDGDMTTVWSAEHNDVKPSIILDLNSLSEVLSIDLFWRQNFPADYKVHISTDQQHWQLFAQGKDFISAGHHCLKSNKQTQCRYIKISFLSPKQTYALEQIMLNGESFHPLKDIAEADMYIGNVWPGRCAFPDFTSQACQDWWKQLYPDFIACGIDGVWNDMNEPAVFGGGPLMTIADEVQHAGGLRINDKVLDPGPHNKYHNAYGMLMAKATREGMLLAQPNKRPFVLTRANYIGGQRYAATWTGDNKSTIKHMKLATPMCLNLGMSGQSFVGPDLGGFAGDARGDLFAQWMAITVFYPFMRAHSSKGTNRKEPWSFGTKIEDSCRRSLQRRYRLLPYLYTQFYLSSTMGQPIMQAAFFADLANKALRQEENKFLLGNDLLIVPPWDKTKRFPRGNWALVELLGDDYEDEFQVKVYLREGCILALGNKATYAEEQNPYQLELIINPDKNGEANSSVYIDSGDGWSYKDGDYDLISITYQNGQLETPNKKVDLSVLDIIS